MRYLLLDESGELSWWNRRRIRRALRRDPEAARLQAGLKSLLRASRESAPPPGPSPHVWERIREEAAEHLNRLERLETRRAPEPFARLWRPALVYGTISLLLLAAAVGLYVSMPRDELHWAKSPGPEPVPYAAVSWPETLERDMTELESELAALERDMDLAHLFQDPLWIEISELAEELIRLEDQPI